MPKSNTKERTPWPEEDAPFPEHIEDQEKAEHETLYQNDGTDIEHSSVGAQSSLETMEMEHHHNDHTVSMKISEQAIATRNNHIPWMQGLNEEQQKAVESLDGPVLVLAGAGTGKTRVLTTRIAHILATNSAYPSQVLAVTFTNKAAREMKERIGQMVGGTVEGMPWLGTFHSIATRILRRHAEMVGLRSDFTILDTDDQVREARRRMDRFPKFNHCATITCVAAGICA